MKIFSTHHIHKVLAVAIVGLLFGAAYFAHPSFIKTQEAQAGTGENLSGFAWSENIGWISFNSTSDGSAVSYGVNVDTSTQGALGTGLFSGYAWSENIGWISFNPTETAPNVGTSYCTTTYGGTNAQVSWSTRKVSGWARALAGDTTSGWDGCIKFSKDGVNSWTGSGTYDGVAFSANNLVGHAWGSDVIGWIDFAPTVGGNPIAQRVKLTAPSIASVTASVTPTAVASGVPFTLTMSSTGANSCKWSRVSTPSSLKDFTSTNIPASNGGPLQFNNNNNFIEAGPLSVTWTFICTNSANGTSATASANLNIGGPLVSGPWVSIIADPATITSGGSSILRWVSGGGVTSCTASGGGWSGTKAIEGTQVVSPTVSGTNYSIDCTGVTGPASDNVTITVNAPPAPTPYVTIFNTNQGNGTYNITWLTGNFPVGATVTCSAPSWTTLTGDSGTQTGIVPTPPSTNYPITCTDGTTPVSGSTTIVVGTPSCNNNGKCEPSNNENTISCPKDCATIGGTGTR